MDFLLFFKSEASYLSVWGKQTVHAPDLCAMRSSMLRQLARMKPTLPICLVRNQAVVVNSTENTSIFWLYLQHHCHSLSDQTTLLKGCALGWVAAIISKQVFKWWQLCQKSEIEINTGTATDAVQPWLAHTHSWVSVQWAQWKGCNYSNVARSATDVATARVLTLAGPYPETGEWAVGPVERLQLLKCSTVSYRCCSTLAGPYPELVCCGPSGKAGITQMSFHPLDWCL